MAENGSLPQPEHRDQFFRNPGQPNSHPNRTINRTTMKLLVSILLNLAVVQGHSSLLHDNHPFIPPDIDEELGISRQRGPCPGLNTLANHGFINRNGTGITFRSVAYGAEMAFGTDTRMIHSISMLAFYKGATTYKVESELSFDLFGLYSNNVFESYGRFFRTDDYYQELPQFNETIFDGIVALAENGIVSVSDLLEHRIERIRQARTSNPEATFAFGTTDEYATGGATELILLANMGQDPELQSVPLAALRAFAQDNRLPYKYSPRNIRGLPLLALDDPVVSAIHGKAKQGIAAAIMGPLDNDSDNSRPNVEAAVIGNVLAVGVAVLVSLWHIVARKKKASNLESAECPPPNNTCPESDSMFVSDPSAVHTDDLDSATYYNEPKTLSWQNISVVVQSSSSDNKRKTILSDVSGNALSGQLTCILGASGSGKTTLLSILGGSATVRTSKGASIEGTVMINGEVIEPITLSMSKQHGLAFVGQHDSFLESVTPREAIRFSARLRLPRDVSEDFISDLTSDILSDLKLKHVQDQIISRNRGMSGGEKRRVSLGLELVTRPQVLLLDEVTSGM